MGHNQLWPAKAPVNTLSPSRFQVLDCALQNVLATDIAEETMAQLIDGLPLYRVGGNQGGQRIYRGHPLREHTELCPGVIEKTRLFRQNFAVSQVHVLARVSRHYTFRPITFFTYGFLVARYLFANHGLDSTVIRACQHGIERI